MVNKFILVCVVSFICLNMQSRSENNALVTFHEGMTNFKEYYSQDLPENNMEWNIVKQLYDNFALNSESFSATPIIPKIIHQIWLGSPLPEKCRVLRESWIKLHPDWEFKLWREEDIEAFGLKNKTYYDAATNYGEKSDIARYEILYRFGGLYIDTDFECLQPFDFFHHRCDFYTGLCIGNTRTAGLANGLIGSIQLHPILKECIDTMTRPLDAKNDADSIMHRTGPYHFTRCFFRVIKNCSDKTIVFPVNYFYPWPHYFRYQNEPNEIQKWIRPESFGLHYWHTSWVNKKGVGSERSYQ